MGTRVFEFINTFFFSTLARRSIENTENQIRNVMCVTILIKDGKKIVNFVGGRNLLRFFHLSVKVEMVSCSV